MTTAVPCVVITAEGGAAVSSPLPFGRTEQGKQIFRSSLSHFVQQFADSMDKAIETIPEEIMRSLVRHFN